MKNVFALAAAGLLVAASSAFAGKAEDAAKYTNDLKSSKDVKVKITAAEEIGKLASINKKYGKDAIEYLIDACKDKNSKLRATAAEALGKSYNEDDDKAVTLLTTLMKDDGDMDVRIAATKGLAAMGAKAKPAVPTMRELMAKEDDKSRFKRALRDSMRTIVGQK